MNPDNFTDQLDWLYAQFPNYQHQGQQAYKPGLENTYRLLECFGNPQTTLKAIHVAGTNGKGSVCSYLASILCEKKYKVGLFTSPHLWDFRERIRVNGKKIDQQFVVDFCKKIQSEKLSFEPSFFEITYVMALCYFKHKKCTYSIIETGMGGRLDATNTLHPILSIITNIGLDHTQFLGTDLVSIAKEKGGIIKASVPVVIGQRQSKVTHVFSKLTSTLKSPLLYAESVIFEHHKLNTHYKRENFSTALSAMKVLQIDCSVELLTNAMNNLESNAGLVGRFMQIHSSPNIFIDVAHNLDGINSVLKEFKNQKLQIIYGTSSDKNYQEIVRRCMEYGTLHLCSFTNPRSWTSKQMHELKEQYKAIVSVHSNINEALDSLLPTFEKNENLLLCGSFFLLSDLKISNYNLISS